MFGQGPHSHVFSILLSCPWCLVFSSPLPGFEPKLRLVGVLLSEFFRPSPTQRRHKEETSPRPRSRKIGFPFLTVVSTFSFPSGKLVWKILVDLDNFDVEASFSPFPQAPPDPADPSFADLPRPKDRLLEFRRTLGSPRSFLLRIALPEGASGEKVFFFSDRF